MQCDTIKLLIDNGANINDVNNEGLNVLAIFIKYIIDLKNYCGFPFYISDENILAVFKLLLQNGSDTNCSIYKNSLLKHLVGKRDVKIVKEILQHKEQHDKINKDELSQLLKDVAKTSNVMMAKTLIDYGAEFDDTIYKTIKNIEMLNLLTTYGIMRKLNSIELRLESLEEQSKNLSIN